MNIELLILDVDGVMTNGTFWYDSQGNEHKAFNSLDGFGIKRLQSIHIPSAIISGRQSEDVTRRAQNLGIKTIIQGQHNKLDAFQKILSDYNVHPDHVACMGDDVPDLVIMQSVGLPIAVNNAVDEVKAIAKYCTQRNGGEGAVREACDYIYQQTQKHSA